jgi:hypothetical protein
MREAAGADGRHSNPTPDPTEIKAHSCANAVRAGTHWGTGCQIWGKSPVANPVTPRTISAAANAA